MLVFLLMGQFQRIPDSSSDNFEHLCMAIVHLERQAKIKRLEIIYLPMGVYFGVLLVHFDTIKHVR